MGCQGSARDPVSTGFSYRIYPARKPDKKTKQKETMMKFKGMARNLAVMMAALAALMLSSCAATMGGVVMSSAEIKAPVDKVFNYVADFRNAKEYIPGVESVSNITGQGLGTTLDWRLTYKGQHASGRMVVTDFTPNQRIVLNSTCGKIITILFSPAADNGTRLTVSVMFASEVPVEGKPVKKIVVAGTQEMFDGMVRNVKKAVEE
jgi:carbon monoxide dehydrogenase subunit G